MKTISSWSLIIALTIGLFGSFPGWAQEGSSGNNGQNLHMVLVGDTMLGSKGRIPPYEGTTILPEATPFLKKADVTIGNLEGAVGTRGTQRKNCQKCYSFQSPPWAITRLQEAGFDMWSLANNHAMDFGMEGAQDTVYHLNQGGMVGTGILGMAPALFEVKGKKVCLLAYAPNYNTNSVLNIDKMVHDVSKTKPYCSVLVVSMHVGAEGSDKFVLPQGQETYLGENRGNSRMFAKRAILAGADVVMGHGPHVPRALELYQGKLIAYSLGNFATVGMSTQGALGYAPLLSILLNEQGNFVGGRVVSFVQQNQQLVLDQQHKAFLLMKRQSISDAPSGLVFGETGEIWVAPQK